MVQMKLILTVKEAVKRAIYIPHGSDETWEASSSQKIRAKIYIPHGSDETRQLYLTF